LRRSASGQWENPADTAALRQDSAMASESSWDLGERAASALAPEVDLVNSDVAGFGQALIQALQASATNPFAMFEANMRLAADMALIGPVSLVNWLGGTAEPRIAVDPKDRRFSDEAWKENPAFYSLRLAYLSARQYAERVVRAAGLEAPLEAKAQMALDLLLDAMAPTNFLPTNPAALKKAFDTGGASVVRGAAHFVDDVLNNNGRPRQVDTSPFRLGENLAATPAKVVYRNHLMELLQYEPQTPEVHAEPLLFSPPWINKYYVMDLAPGRSFVEWAVKHGRTVFAISYRNPSAEMAGVTMDDYLIHGPHQALDVIEEITGAEQIDIVGLCLGGALTAISAAYLTASGDTRVGNLTLLNTMLDYSDPGALGVFTDESAVARLEKQMRTKGALEGESMAGTFDMLRANDLIFNYVVSNWLMGQDPPAFDILAWNSDSTRMPAAMHSFYLRNFYVENRLAKGTLEIAGRIVNLAEIKRRAYVVSAQNDHIVPWRSAYATTGLLAGPVRFVLSSGGHIAGIVNPPGPKGRYYVADTLPPTAEQWRERAEERSGSWWEDWAAWSEEHAGPMVAPPPMGSAQHPVLCEGPGTYVFT
jgi:polyhydroxyalkanoate synthase